MITQPPAPERAPTPEPARPTPPTPRTETPPPVNHFENLQRGISETRKLLDERSLGNRQRFFVDKKAVPDEDLSRDDETQRQLSILDNYVEHQVTIEGDRATIAERAEKIREAIEQLRENAEIPEETRQSLLQIYRAQKEHLHDFDVQNIPAELRGEQPLTEETGIIAQTYAQQVSPEIENLRAEMDRIRSARVETETIETAASAQEPVIEVHEEETREHPETGPDIIVTATEDDEQDFDEQELQRQLAEMNPQQRDEYILEQDARLRSLGNVIDLAIKAATSQNPSKSQWQNNLFQARRIIKAALKAGFHSEPGENQATNTETPSAEPEQLGQPPNHPAEQTRGDETQQPEKVSARQVHINQDALRSGEIPPVTPEEYETARGIVYEAIRAGANNINRDELDTLLRAVSQVGQFADQHLGQPNTEDLENFAQRAEELMGKVYQRLS